MKVTRSISVEPTGVGKPDYSREVSSGRTRPGFTLKYGQSLSYLAVILSGIASPFPIVQPPLAAGGTIHLIDGETYAPTPYTIPVGYTWSAFQIGYGLNQDSRLQAYLDGNYMGQLILASSGLAHVIAEVAAFSSKLFDPTGAVAHTFDFVLENTGGANMEGAASVWGILEAVGTEPLPENKTVVCKRCGNKTVVPRETTKLKCPKCGYETLYFDLSRIREL